MDIAKSRRVFLRDSALDWPKVLSEYLNILLADVFALYLKTKSFHWHISGPNFRDYHILLGEQASELFRMTDVIAERVRKLGAPTLCSIGAIHRLQRIPDCDATQLQPGAMLNQLLQDNRQLVADMAEAHWICEQEEDLATARFLETFIDEGERRAWFLREICGGPETSQ